MNLLDDGKTQEETTNFVGLFQSAVSRVWKHFKEGGEEGLALRNSPWAPAKLTAKQKAMRPKLLADGPDTYDFEGNLGTRGRVQTVIWESFGISYCESHVGVILKPVGLSLQKPRRRDFNFPQARLECVCYFACSIFSHDCRIGMIGVNAIKLS